MEVEWKRFMERSPGEIQSGESPAEHSDRHEETESEQDDEALGEGGSVEEEEFEIEHRAKDQEGKFGDVSLGPAINQDYAVWEVQQRGLHSRGYQRDFLAGQEDRVRFFHENLERWMAR